MTEAISALSRSAVAAAQEEVIAQRTIRAVMTMILGGRIDAAVFRSGAGGLAYASWANALRTKGLVVRQAANGMCVAVDIRTGLALSRGDGLSGVVDDVVRYYLRRMPQA